MRCLLALLLVTLLAPTVEAGRSVSRKHVVTKRSAPARVRTRSHSRGPQPAKVVVVKPIVPPKPAVKVEIKVTPVPAP